MRRKKDPQNQPVDPAKFWPVPGVDGEPYPPRVQEALDLVAKETLRRKRAECSHADRMFITGSGQDRYGSRIRYRRACRDCHLVVDCEHPEEAQRRERVKHIGDGSFVEFLECRCGKMIAKRVEPKRRTEIYGVPYERREESPRRSDTAWLKTEEQERREARRIPSWEKEVRRVQSLLDTAERYSEGAMAQSTETYILRKANGEMVLRVTGDRAPDLSWVRTMNGRQQLR